MAINRYVARTAAAVTLLAASASAVTPLIVQGSQFVENAGSKNRFQVVGVDYQPGGASGYDSASGRDPLSDADICLRDATVLQALGINTIRVYNVNPSVNHDSCASIFNAAGIYMIVDVNSPLVGENIDRSAPANSYNSDYLKRIFAVVENFKNYPNVAGFFAGNEVINEEAKLDAVPGYMRAVIRDLKAYISKHAPRTIPVGYSAADVRPVLASTWQYLQCSINGDTSSSMDFFGLNSYSWCGDSDFQKSGYDKLVDQFSNSSVPVFFSEYGCNKVTPRTFTNVPILYGPQMTSLSGGLVYEYTQEDNNYGLVKEGENGAITLSVDFDNLQKQYNGLDTKLITSSNTANANNKPPACDAGLVDATGFQSTFKIPDQPSGAADLISSGISSPKQGKLVDVTNTTPKQTINGSNGQPVSNLKLKILANDQSNLPNGGSTSASGPPNSGTGTGSSPSPSASKTGAAARTAVSSAALILGALVGAFLF